VENITRAGWVKYQECILKTETGLYTETTQKHTLGTGNYGTFHTVRNNGWLGSAVVFILPADSYLPDTTTRYTDLAVHYEYEGYVEYLDLHQRFNVIGTYDHTRYALSYEPTVTLDVSMNPVAVTLSFSVSMFPDIEDIKDTRIVELPTSIEYTPE
jgi:hypothetical protein